MNYRVDRNVRDVKEVRAMSISSPTPAHRAFLTALRLPDVFWTMFVRGVFAVIFGVLVLAWPAVTALALALLFGVYALVNGVSTIVAVIRGDELFRRWLVALSGLVSIAAGLVTLLWPGITVLALTLVVGVWAMATGLSEIVAAVRLRRALDHKVFLVVIGVLSVIAGALLVWHPLTGALGIAIVVGSYAVVYGVLLIGVAVWLRHTVRRSAVS
jgi:uncharacterized membrane protein HdeD (DUF308 family)